MPLSPLRWVAIFVFILASTLNYLDRQLLAALAPVLKKEFALTNQDYGFILTSFSIIYAISAPFAGLFLDRVGLNIGTTVAVAVWSLASAGHALVSGFRGLLGFRALLGVAEAAGIPSTGKVTSMYLAPNELAMGTAFSQLGISLGSMAAPILVAFLAPRYGWQSPFLVSGVLGFLWIPLWLMTSRLIPAKPVVAHASKSVPLGDMIRDTRLWGLMVGNVFYMVLYSLWTNWTTLYFVSARGLTQEQANQQFAWIPPVFATIGAFAGGSLALRMIRGGSDVIQARLRILLLASICAAVAAAVPFVPSSILAAACISASYFFISLGSTNLYSMPIDIFGSARAGFGVAALTMAYGLMQAFFSPLIGRLVDTVGFTAVCTGAAAMPLLAWFIMKFTVK